LSFWLATAIDRRWILLLPLLAAMPPRLMPPLMTMHPRSRI